MTSLPHATSYRYSADRGVYAVQHSDGVTAFADTMAVQPSTLRALLDGSVHMYDLGTLAGMSDARRDRGNRVAYDAHRAVAAGLRRTSNARSFSDGYVSGFAAVAYGVIA